MVPICLLLKIIFDIANSIFPMDFNSFVEKWLGGFQKHSSPLITFPVTMLMKNGGWERNRPKKN